MRGGERRLRILKVFVKKSCPACPTLRASVERAAIPSNVEVRVCDLDTADGLAESAFHSVLSTPALILCDEAEKELRSWNGSGNIPVPSDIEAALV